MKALLLDRDGVLIEERDYDYTPGNIRLLPKVQEGLHCLQGKGYRFFVVSNQSGVGRGLDTTENVEACNARLRTLLSSEGILLADMVFCPHHPNDGCGCRKPALGMWDTLRENHQLTSRDCIMVGNSENDIAFGRAIGCFTAFVASAGEERGTGADLVIPDLLALAEELLRLR